MWYAIALLIGAVAGAVAMYYLAPKISAVQAKVKAKLGIF